VVRVRVWAGSYGLDVKGRARLSQAGLLMGSWSPIRACSRAGFLQCSRYLNDLQWLACV
jgi:hypothetical protein